MPSINMPAVMTARMMALAAVMALVPVLFVPVPGFTDAPAHLARHHILASAPFGGPLAKHYVVGWQWIANMGEDIPAALLGRLLGGEWATRLITALIAPLTICGIAALSRAVHGRVAASALLAAPLALHQAWMYGFLNYCLGTALALLSAAWLYAARERQENHGWRGHVILGALGLIVWTAHLVCWGILLLLAAGKELGEVAHLRKSSVHDLLPALSRNAPLLLPIIPLVLWRSHADGAGLALAYDSFALTKLGAFLGALRGTWMKLDFAMLGGVVIAGGLACMWARDHRADRRLLIAGLLLVAVVIAVPAFLFDSWGTDMRLAPVALIVLILAIGPATDPRKNEIIAVIGLSLFIVRLGTVTWVWADRSPEWERRLELLDAVPRGSQLGYVFVPGTCDGWKLLPDEKLASYAVTRREAFVNTMFMVDNARLVTLRDPKMQARWTSDSQRIDNTCPGNTYDRAVLHRKLAEMRRDGFDVIWVSGVKREDLPPISGYVVVRRWRNDMILRRLRS